HPQQQSRAPPAHGHAALPRRREPVRADADRVRGGGSADLSRFRQGLGRARRAQQAAGADAGRPALTPLDESSFHHGDCAEEGSSPSSPSSCSRSSRALGEAKLRLPLGEASLPRKASTPFAAALIASEKGGSSPAMTSFDGRTKPPRPRASSRPSERCG